MDTWLISSDLLQCHIQNKSAKHWYPLCVVSYMTTSLCTKIGLNWDNFNFKTKKSHTCTVRLSSTKPFNWHVAQPKNIICYISPSTTFHVSLLTINRYRMKEYLISFGYILHQVSLYFTLLDQVLHVLFLQFIQIL